MEAKGFRPRGAGFTLVELVMVLVIVGILAAVAMPRFASRDAFDVSGFAEDARGVIRYTQKTAIAQHRTTVVNLDTAGRLIAACFDTAYPCASPLPDPSSGGPLRLVPASTVAFAASNAQIRFDWLGAAGGTSATLTVSPVAGGNNTLVTVDGDTGYVQ